MLEIKASPYKRNTNSPDAHALWTDSDGNVWLVEFDWKISNRSARVSGFSINAVDHKAPITARLLRQFPMGQAEEQLRAFHGERRRGNKKDVFRVADPEQPSVSVAEIRQVADFYFQAKKDGISPHQKIIMELKVSYPTASRRIRLARDMGLIPNSK
jgi:hypothetical protein